MTAILKITLKLDLTRNFAMALYQIFTTTIRSTISENLVLLAETWVTVQDGGYQFLALPFFTLLEILKFIKHKKKNFKFLFKLEIDSGK
jgi:hypothetical protein